MSNQAISWSLNDIGALDERSKKCKEFARISTPRGWRTKLAAELGKLEGNCFPRCLRIAYNMSDLFYYCEGYADGTPYAWLSPKRIRTRSAEGLVLSIEGPVIPDEDWALDPTWRWFKYRKDNGKKLEIDFIDYVGFRFEAKEVHDWLTNRHKTTGLYTSCSILKHASEIPLELLK